MIPDDEMGRGKRPKFPTTRFVVSEHKASQDSAKTTGSAKTASPEGKKPKASTTKKSSSSGSGSGTAKGKGKGKGKAKASDDTDVDAEEPKARDLLLELVRCLLHFY